MNFEAEIFEHLNLLVICAGLFFSVLLFVFYYTVTRSRSVISYLPNIWTSLGILGTFISIVKCLMGSNDLSNMESVIRDIVPAFQTSIIGIVGAIVTSVLIKAILAIEDKKYEEEYDKKSYSVNMTPELLLDNINQSLKVANNKIDGLAGLVAAGVLEEVDKHLVSKMEELAVNHSARLVSLFEQEESSLADATAKVSDATSVMLESIKASFALLQSSVGAVATDTLAKTEKISETFAVSVAGIEEKTLASLSSKLTERYRQLLALNEESIALIKERIEEMESELIDQMVTGIAEINSGVISDVEDMYETVRDNMEVVAENLANVSESLKFNTANYQSVSAATTEIRNSFVRLESVMSNCIAKMETSALRLESLVNKSDELHELNYKLAYEVAQLKKAKAVKVKVLSDGTWECPDCGHANPSRANYCRKCRYKFVVEEER